MRPFWPGWREIHICACAQHLRLVRYFWIFFFSYFFEVKRGPIRPFSIFVTFLFASSRQQLVIFVFLHNRRPGVTANKQNKLEDWFIQRCSLLCWQKVLSGRWSALPLSSSCCDVLWVSAPSSHLQLVEGTVLGNTSCYFFCLSFLFQYSCEMCRWGGSFVHSWSNGGRLLVIKILRVKIDAQLIWRQRKVLAQIYIFKASNFDILHQYILILHPELDMRNSIQIEIF